MEEVPSPEIPPQNIVPGNSLPPLPDLAPSPVLPSTPAEIVTSPPPSEIPTPKRGHKKVWIIGIVVLILVLLGGGGFSVALAYGKISINNPSIEQPLSQFVLGLPFMPKTPKYLLESAVLAQSKVTKDSFDVSVAAQSDDYTAALGLNQLDADIKGQVDYSDTTNLKLNLNAAITKEFNMDLRKNNSTVYLKINQVPDLVWTLLKIDPSKVMPIFANWIALDTDTLQTEARKTLNQQNQQKSLTKEYLDNTLDQFLDKNLLSNLTVSNDTIDGHSAYKLHLAATDSVVDSLVSKIESQAAANQGQKTSDLNISTTKPSQYLKNLVIDMWIDQSNYYVREVSTSFKLYPNVQAGTVPTRVLGISKVLGVSKVVDPSNVLGIDSSLYSFGKNPVAIALVAKFDKFGEAFTVETPSPVLKSDEFIKQIMSVTGYGQPSTPSATTSPAFSHALQSAPKK